MFDRSQSSTGVHSQPRLQGVSLFNFGGRDPGSEVGSFNVSSAVRVEFWNVHVSLPSHQAPRPLLSVLADEINAAPGDEARYNRQQLKSRHR